MKSSTVIFCSPSINLIHVYVTLEKYKIWNARQNQLFVHHNSIKNDTKVSGNCTVFFRSVMCAWISNGNKKECAIARVFTPVHFVAHRRHTHSYTHPCSNNIKVSERAFNLLYFSHLLRALFCSLLDSKMSFIFAHTPKEISAKGEKDVERDRRVNEWKGEQKIHNSLFVNFRQAHLISSICSFLSHFNSSLAVRVHGMARHDIGIGIVEIWRK